LEKYIKNQERKKRVP